MIHPHAFSAMLRTCAALLLAAALSACAPTGGQQLPCNGSDSLCLRRYDQVVYPGTHNAMSSTEDRWIAPNQGRSTARQLRDGIRAMMLDLHYWTGKVFLCHSVCGIGNRDLLEFLQELRTFLAVDFYDVGDLMEVARTLNAE